MTATPHPSTASLRSGCHLPLKGKALAKTVYGEQALLFIYISSHWSSCEKRQYYIWRVFTKIFSDELILLTFYQKNDTINVYGVNLCKKEI